MVVFLITRSVSLMHLANMDGDWSVMVLLL